MKATEAQLTLDRWVPIKPEQYAAEITGVAFRDMQLDVEMRAAADGRDMIIIWACDDAGTKKPYLLSLHCEERGVTHYFKRH